MRTMYDSTDVGALPEGGDLYAGYVDGNYRTWISLGVRFGDTSARLVSITVTGGKANVLDVETGDATPNQAPGWALSMRQLGMIPTVYCSAENWPMVRSAFIGAQIAEPEYWIAAYPGPGPVLYPTSIAHQYEDTGNYDVSVVADYWPGVDPPPLPIPKGEQMIAATSTGLGYWVVKPTGAVYAYGDATYEGGANVSKVVSVPPPQQWSGPPALAEGDTIVGIAGTGTGGYWLVSDEGAVFAYGSAVYHGGPNEP